MALTKVTSTFIETISTAQILQSGAVAGDVLSFDGATSKWKPKTPTAGGTVNSVALSSDGSLEVKGSPITAAGTIGISISSINLNKLSRSGATPGQAIRWDGSTNTWVPSALPAAAGTVTNVVLNSPDNSLQITGSPINTTGTFGASIFNVGLDKLNKTGAATGNLIAYNGTAWAINNTINVASGKVGINTASPSQLLTVNGNLDTTAGNFYAGGVLEKALTATVSNVAPLGLVTLNVGAATVFNINLTSNINHFRFINTAPVGSNTVYNITLVITHAGGNFIIWRYDISNVSSTFRDIKWSEGIAPTMTPTTGKTDIYSLLSTDGGSNWYGFIGGLLF